MNYRYAKAALTLWKGYIMAKNTLNIAKGVGAGLVAGVMFGFVSSVMMKDSRKNKRKAAKAISTVEGILDGMQEIFK